MFYGGFCKVCKMKNKNEDIKMKFWSFVQGISEMSGMISSNLVCRFPFLAGTSVANLVLIG